MLNILIENLKTFDDVEYLIKETKTQRVESYNIKKQTEMNREVETTLIVLTLYVTFEEEGKKYRGSYSTEIHPGTDTETLKTIISEGVYAAGFVKNAFFPLVEPTPATLSKNQDLDIAATLVDLQTGFHECDNHTKGHISYSEFFVTRSDVRILNSNGVDVSFTTYTAFVETAVHMPSGDKEIEITEAYRFSVDDNSLSNLKARVDELFAVAEKKSKAKPTPSVGDINILLSGECLSTFFSYYLNCSSAQMVYRQLSTFKEGTDVQGGGDSDRICMILDPLMKGSSLSRGYDDHGFPLASQKIIENGKLLKFWGDTRFASYLEIPPTGIINNIKIEGGTATSLRDEPYLELVSFSDFQVDPVTGDFGSEIRLGYYFDGKTTTPITGGSISGNMAKVQDGLKMSVETRQYNNYHGPATICMRGASISGVEG